MILDFDKAYEAGEPRTPPSQGSWGIFNDWAFNQALEAQAQAAVRQAQRALLEEVAQFWTNEAVYEWIAAKRRELGEP